MTERNANEDQANAQSNIHPKYCVQIFFRYIFLLYECGRQSLVQEQLQEIDIDYGERGDPEISRAEQPRENEIEHRGECLLPERPDICPLQGMQKRLVFEHPSNRLRQCCVSMARHHFPDRRRYPLRLTMTDGAR